MNKYLTPTFVLLFALFGVSFSSQTASAADLSKFSAGNIMSDYVMSNKDSMTEVQIQQFLTNKNSCNDSNIGKAAQYPNMVYNIKDGKFVCLSNEVFNGETAAKIIWQAGQDYNINPQVLIVLLQKEQGLVTDTWPNHNIQYRSATGYGCPDNAPCEEKYYGFKNQVRNAANFFRAHLDNRGGWYKPHVPGGQNIKWSPSSCGAGWVNIENRATSGLYSYTPYQPNRAALNAGYGSGDGCSSYGNRNFWAYFNDWFGSTITNTLPVVTQLEQFYNTIGSYNSYLGIPTTLGGCKIKNNGCYQNFQSGHIYWSPDTGAWDISGAVGNKWLQSGAEHALVGYPTSSEFRGLKNGGSYQQFQIGRIYWSPDTGAYPISGSIGNKWLQSGAEHALVGYPTSSEFRGLKNGGSYQQFQIGRIYWSPDTGAYPISGGIGNYWKTNGAEKGTLGYPTGTEKSDGSGRMYQEFEGGKVYWTATKGAWGVVTP